MAIKKDIIGQKFNRLTVVEDDGTRSGNGCVKWRCICECGRYTHVEGNHLKSGRHRSCGCLQKEVVGNINRTHGEYNTNLYRRWAGMKSRCFCEGATEYNNYGGRGITMCQEWLEYENFAKWAKDNGYKEELTIERINNDGNYEPDNCCWKTISEQRLNTSMNVFLTLRGETKTMKEWADATGINPKTLHTRLRVLGWSVERALTEPVQKSS